jgi:hypothetical protein
VETVGHSHDEMNQDQPTPETYPLPDAVLAVQDGKLRIPQRDGFKASRNMMDGCKFCALRLQHEHGGLAAFPF